MAEVFKSETTGLMWYRGSLRIRDNAALYAALLENETVYCLYVLDDFYLKNADIGAARVNFLLKALSELALNLEAQGGQLIVRNTRQVAEEVIRVAQEVGAGRIYINEDYLPYPIQRDTKVAELANEVGIELKQYQDILLVEPSGVLTDNGNPYSVFTPFKRRWEGMLNTPEAYRYDALLHKLKTPKKIAGQELPTLETYGLHLKQDVYPVGEKAAYKRLEDFVSKGLPEYHQNRDNAFDPESTSVLSAHIKWGTVSIRDCYRVAREQGGPGAAKWIDELAWREFYYAIIYHFPHSLEGPMLKEYGGFPWIDSPANFDAWKAGMTGYPFVDAGMRQLNETGWMHNRLRQVTASYLVKDLCINWQDGERYFMQQLACGDWPSNNGGWQWVAGTGTDPRRATRIFNPVLQMERYDPQAEYVRRWVPEYGTSRYPKPIVPHNEGRDEFLRRFATTAGGREAIRAARREEAEIAKRGTKQGSGRGQKKLF